MIVEFMRVVAHVFDMRNLHNLLNVFRDVDHR